MKLLLSINYTTNWGEMIFAQVTTYSKRGKHEQQMLPLHTTNGKVWTSDFTITGKDLTYLEYTYVVMNGEHEVRREWNNVNRQIAFDDTKNICIEDRWRDIPVLAHLYSSAYCRVEGVTMHVGKAELPYYDKTIIMRVQAPQLRKGECLGLVGNVPMLGSWQADRALRLLPDGMHEWCISLSGTSLQMPFEYKYVILKEDTGEVVAWEEGENRKTPVIEQASNDVLILADSPLRRIDPHWKVAGCVVPVFSLRSEGSQGVGDFGDLQTMVDWAKQTGMKMIQLLPIYDTTQSRTWMDSYPYNAISVYALHPIYLDIRQLEKVNDEGFMHEYELQRERLNSEFTVDYEQVTRMKRSYLQRLYRQEGPTVLESPAFKRFFSENAPWLMPYAAFSYLRDKYGTCDFNQWPEYSVYKREEIARFCAPAREHYYELAYFFYLQFVLHLQLLKTSEYARQHGVVLKGDIPIGISRCSVEAWVEPHYFHMNGQAGAPPDDFCAEGQNWGFPTYNWERIAEDGFRWWKARLTRMATYFDAYRIDHVLGFFRIWQIPLHSVQGLLGYFSPALPMSPEEIESFGLTFRKEYFTTPLITEGMLYDYFGDKIEEVKTKYLTRAGRDSYQLKPEYQTQIQVKEAMGECKTQEEQDIRYGLYRLISNVLFIEDVEKPGYYHPRIDAMKDYFYDSLSQVEKNCFSALYEEFFYHRHNQFWAEKAMEKLPALNGATRMLCCAEDLGMVPACVRPVMEELRMLSLEIQTMPKDLGVRFSRLEANPYRSVATIFTHDMSTLRMWWEEDAERAQQYYNEVLQKDGEAPHSIPGWMCEEVVARHLFSPSMLCLISLQNWLSIDDNMRYPDPSEERINIPANPRHYWRYRMPLYLEQLLSAGSFNDKIKTLIDHAQR